MASESLNKRALKRKALTDKIESHILFEEDVFDNFKQLCLFFGIKPVTGKQRIYLKKLFSCYFDYQQIPGTNKIEILETYFDNPKPYPDETTKIRNTAFNVPMQDLIMDKFWEENVLYLPNNMLRAMNLVLSVADVSDRSIAHRDYVRKMYQTLESAIFQINAKWDEEKQTLYNISKVFCTVSYNKEGQKIPEYILTSEEVEQYQNIIKDVLLDIGCTSRFMVYQKGKEKTFWAKVNAKAQKAIGITDIYEGYVFSKSNCRFRITDYEANRIKLCKLTAENMIKLHKLKCEKFLANVAFGTAHNRYQDPEDYEQDMKEVLDEVLALGEKVVTS